MSISTYTNKELIKRIKKADQKAFQMLYEKLWQSLFIKAVAMLGDKDVAKDIIQEVWISLWEKKAEIKNDNIEGYLMTAVRYKVYNKFRNSKYQNKLIEEFTYKLKVDQGTSNIDDFINFNTTKKHIDAIISKLPRRCKEVFELSRFDGMKNNEIAEKLNISQRTVETHISNAIKVIKANLVTFIVYQFGMLDAFNSCNDYYYFYLN